MPGIQDKKLPGGSKSAKILFEYAILTFFAAMFGKNICFSKVVKNMCKSGRSKKTTLIIELIFTNKFF